jgi:hypothetical protein
MDGLARTSRPHRRRTPGPRRRPRRRHRPGRQARRHPHSSRPAPKQLRTEHIFVPLTTARERARGHHERHQRTHSFSSRGIVTPHRRCLRRKRDADLAIWLGVAASTTVRRSVQHERSRHAPSDHDADSSPAESVELRIPRHARVGRVEDEGLAFTRTWARRPTPPHRPTRPGEPGDDLLELMHVAHRCTFGGACRLQMRPSGSRTCISWVPQCVFSNGFTISSGGPGRQVSAALTLTTTCSSGAGLAGCSSTKT